MMVGKFLVLADHVSSYSVKLVLKIQYLKNNNGVHILTTTTITMAMLTLIVLTALMVKCWLQH